MSLMELQFEKTLNKTNEDPELYLKIENEILRIKQDNLERKLKESESSIKKSIGKVFKLILITALIIFPLYFEEELRLGWGYDIQKSGDDTYITRYGDIVVGLTIIDTQILSEYLIGIRLPSKDIQCGHKLMRVASDDKTYFILDLDATQVTNFYSKKEFVESVSLLPGYENLKLRFELFERIFEFSTRLDGKEHYKDCLEHNGLLGRRVVWLMS